MLAINILTTNTLSVILSVDSKTKERDMAMNRMTVVEAIESLREAMQVSQAKLAEKIGMKHAQGYQNAIGAKKGMRSDNFIKLANALGYDVIIRNRVTDAEIEIIVPADDKGVDEA